MNELNNKEEQIKDILGGLEIDIDTNDIWGNIEADLPQPKRKRRFGFFWIFGLLGIGLAGLVWNSASSKAGILTDTKDANITINEANENIIARNEKAENTIHSVEKPTVNPKIKFNTRANTIENDLASATSSFFTKANKKETNNSTTQENDQAIFEDRIVNQGSQSEQYFTTQNTITTLSNERAINLSDKRDLENDMLMAPTLSNQLFEIVERNRIETTPSSIKPFINQGRQLILQFKLGANRNKTTIDNINSIGEFDGSEFNFERDRIGVSGSFAIGVENNGWRFLAGASYHHHVSSYERDDIIIVTDLTSGIESYKISSDGILSSQNGNISVTSVRDNNISYHRQHKAIDFHASIGKRLVSFKGLVLMADAGLGVNTYTKTTGYYLADKAFGFTKITESDHPYKVNTHWNAIASLELGYDFGKTRIGLSPFIRYNPNSITSQAHLYQLKNSQVGMQLSLTYSPTRE